MVRLLLLSAILSMPAWAECTSSELQNLTTLGYSTLLIQRLCDQETIKQAVLKEQSKPVILYRGIDVPPEKFNPRYNKFKDSIYTATSMKTPLYFSAYKGTIIRYEVPQIYVWGLEADGSWLSVNKKYSKRKGLRSFPNGINDVEHFVTHLGEVDQNKINELIQNKGHDLKKYDMERFWKEFKDQESTFIHYQVYQPSLSGNHCSSFLGNTLKSINNAE